jgi:hypothetical protein
MKFAWLVVLASLCLVGCTSPSSGPGKTADKRDDPPAHEEAAISADGIITIPQATLQAFHLTTARVHRQSFTGDESLMIQVFRESDEGVLPGLKYRLGYAYASALISADAAFPPNGQTVQVSSGGATWKASILRVNVVGGDLSKKREVLLELDDPEHHLILGQTGLARVGSGAVQSVLVVPNAAVLNAAEGTFVYLQLQAGQFKRVPVQLGEKRQDNVEVKDGVKEGDQVVTIPISTLWITELQLKQGGGE